MQVVINLPSLFSFLVLCAADERRCPVAVGATPMRPTLFWLVGVVTGILGSVLFAEVYGATPERNQIDDWVLWGAVPCMWWGVR